MLPHVLVHVLLHTFLHSANSSLAVQGVMGHHGGARVNHYNFDGCFSYRFTFLSYLNLL